MSDILFNHAFILAAGEGVRMRPFTLTTPKPMAVVGGETLIQRIVNQCRDVGIQNLYANACHLAGILEDHLGPQVTWLHEETLLDTGLGIKRALPLIGNNPFYVLGGDSWWQDNGISVFAQMDALWDEDEYDMVIVLQRIDRMHVTEGVGDYHFVDGRPVRALDKSGTHMFTSLRLCHPSLFRNTPDTPFSFLELMDKAERAQRLGAIELNGVWHHLSTMNDVAAVNEWLVTS